MTNLIHYEALRGIALDGLTDPTPLPGTIRVMAHPNTKTIYPLTHDFLRAVGGNPDLQSNLAGSDGTMTSVAAWSLARSVSDIYLGEVQDLNRPAILECYDFAQSIGANLHLISSYGQTHIHADTLTALGVQHRPFADLPGQITKPRRQTVFAAPTPPPEEPEAPETEWPLFRSTYQQLFDETTSRRCDTIYLACYHAARQNNARSPVDIATLIADLWTQHATTPLSETVVVKSVQAAMFRNGLNMKVSPGHLAKSIKSHFLNQLTAEHYQRLATYPDPWRPAATILHACHVDIATIRSLTVQDVNEDGTIRNLPQDIPEEAKVCLAAQRWYQLLDAETTAPFIPKSPIAVRSGIRKVVHELNLPLITSWHGRNNDRWEHHHGITLTELT
jgi:hypothetical protein